MNNISENDWIKLLEKYKSFTNIGLALLELRIYYQFAHSTEVSQYIKDCAECNSALKNKEKARLELIELLTGYLYDKIVDDDASPERLQDINSRFSLGQIPIEKLEAILGLFRKTRPVSASTLRKYRNGTIPCSEVNMKFLKK